MDQMIPLRSVFAAQHVMVRPRGAIEQLLDSKFSSRFSREKDSDPADPPSAFPERVNQANG